MMLHIPIHVWQAVLLLSVTWGQLILRPSGASSPTPRQPRRDGRCF